MTKGIKIMENSINLSPVGKLFFTSLLGWIVNDTKLNWNIKGTPEQIDVFTKAAMTSKEFQAEMKKSDATVETLMQKLNAKIASLRLCGEMM